jgi:hypothetical protein
MTVLSDLYSTSLISDRSYGEEWNGVTTLAPSKNSVYDEMETKVDKIVSVDNEIVRFDSTGGDVQGYSSNAPTINDVGNIEVPGGVDNSPIGQTTPAAGAFTNLSGDGSALTGVGSAAASAITLSAKAAEDITKGQIVYISGATGQTAQVSIADNTVIGKGAVAGMAAETKTTGQTILVRVSGEMTGLNTSTFVDGNKLFLSTAGSMSATSPTSGIVLRLGSVQYSHASSGKVVIRVHRTPQTGAPSGLDLFVRMGDSIGGNKFSFKDYGDNEVASIDSNGNAEFAGLKASTDPVDEHGVGDQGFNDTRYRDVYKTVYIDAAEFVPCTTNGALQGSYEEPTNDIDLDIFLFEGGATPQRIICKRKFDENWDRGVIIGAKFDWNSESGSTAGDTVEWRIKMGAISDGDAIDTALGTRQVISDTLLANDGADWQTTSKTPNITVAGSPAKGDTILIEIDRNGPGADTMAEKARFQGITLQIKLSGAVDLWT